MIYLIDRSVKTAISLSTGMTALREITLKKSDFKMFMFFSTLKYLI